MHLAKFRNLVLILLVLLAFPAGAMAEEPRSRVFGSFTTLFLGHQVIDPDDPSSALYQFPILEFVTLGSDDVGTPGFSVYVNGYGLAHPVRPAYGGRFTGDVLIGTVSYRTPAGAFEGRLGRQMVIDGTGRNAVMDGLYVRGRPGADLELAAWGGLVPFRAFDLSGHRPLVGGRFAWDPWDKGRVGLSFTGEWVDGNMTRRTIGLDYALRAFRWLEVSGATTLDAPQVFQETQLAVAVYPDRHFSMTLDYDMVNPSARIPRTSIFSTFTRGFHHAIGGDVAWRSDGWLGARAYFRSFLYGDGAWGWQAGARPTITFSPSSLAGVEVSRVRSDGNAYTQARAFGLWRPVPRWQVSADVDNYFYDDPVNGFSRSHIVGVANGFEVFDRAWVQGDLTLTVNPEFERLFSGMVKFSYTFSSLVK